MKSGVGSTRQKLKGTKHWGSQTFCMIWDTWILPPGIPSTTMPSSFMIARCSRLVKSKVSMLRRGGVSRFFGLLKGEGRERGRKEGGRV